MASAHVRVRTLQASEVDDLLGWIGGPAPSVAVDDLIRECRRGDGAKVWLLAHCDGGVTWGRWDGAHLVLSCGQYPSRAGHPGWSTPVPAAGNVQQLRLFGEAGEVLVWRREDADRTLAGRLLTDTDSGPDRSRDPARPLTDRYLLLGTEIAAGGEATSEDFTAVTDSAGRVQVLPWALQPRDFRRGQPPLCLRLCHYLERDEATGSVAIATSRLCGIEVVPLERVLGEEQQ